MITEDYVSFEIAKLLKEKGFEGENRDWYNMEGFIEEIGVDDGIDPTAHEDIFNNVIPAPTLQMAMKWLRKVHNISVEPLVDFGSGDEYWWSVDVAYIKKNGLIDELCGYNSYEEACEDGIKYCLENLI